MANSVYNSDVSVPLGYQQITSVVAAQALTVPAGAQYAVICVESQSVRWRDDGTDPTASVGEILTVGQNLVYDGKLSAIKFIEVTPSAKVNISYYKYGQAI
jgi:hypothetical protein